MGSRMASSMLICLSMVLTASVALATDMVEMPCWLSVWAEPWRLGRGFRRRRPSNALSITIAMHSAHPKAIPTIAPVPRPRPAADGVNTAERNTSAHRFKPNVDVNCITSILIYRRYPDKLQNIFFISITAILSTSNI